MTPSMTLASMIQKDDEEILLVQDPDFHKLLMERRRYQGPFVSHQTLRARAQEAISSAEDEEVTACRNR